MRERAHLGHEAGPPAPDVPKVSPAHQHALVDGSPVDPPDLYLGIVPAAIEDGIVRWVTLRERWQDGVASLLVGSICALYVGPFVNPLIKPMIGDLAPNGDSTGFASFLVGLGGISIAGLLIDLVRSRTAKARGDGDAQG
jgi:hypothetical protein